MTTSAFFGADVLAAVLDGFAAASAPGTEGSAAPAAPAAAVPISVRRLKRLSVSLLTAGILTKKWVCACEKPARTLPLDSASDPQTAVGIRRRSA
jgi:hypothetical protein